MLCPEPFDFRPEGHAIGCVLQGAVVGLVIDVERLSPGSSTGRDLVGVGLAEGCTFYTHLMRDPIMCFIGHRFGARPRFRVGPGLRHCHPFRTWLG
jgi:hypothetical protein